jgi:hypothetical protein
MRSVLLPVLLALFAYSSGPRAAADQWTFASSDHFEVYTTGGARRAREALVYFERVRAFFVDVLKLSPDAQQPVRIIVFSGRREFQPYRINDVAIAYYRPGPDRDYIVMESMVDEAYPLVVHEYAHLIMRHSNARYPAWLNEGFAEFFSTISPYGGQMSIGRVPQGRLNYLVSGERMFDLERLFAVTHDSPEYRTQNHAGVFYSQSWALTHMLMTSEGYRQGSSRFLSMISEGVSAAEAMTTVYQKPLKQVLSDLYGYVRSDRFVFFSANYKSPREASSYQTREVPAFEAGLVTANLLAAGRDAREKARAAFDALSAQDPDDMRLLESRAYFEWRAGQREAAGPLFARAIERGSTNARTYRDYAALLGGADPVREEALLRSAVGLDPGDVEARIRLGFALIRQRKGAEALVALESIKQVTPGDAFNLFQVRANAFMMLNRVDEGRAAAAAMLKYATTDSQREYGARLAKSIDDTVAAREAMARAAAERAAAAESRAAAARAGAAARPSPDPSLSATPPMPIVSRSPTATADDAPGPRDVRDGVTRSWDGRDLEIVTGRLRMVVCGSQPAVEIATETRRLRLAIDIPSLVNVIGADGNTVDLQCGSQDTRVRAGFYRPTPLAPQSAGNLRLLDFR